MRNFFFSLKVLKARKRSCTNFVLLCQLRNMAGQIKKAYLHKPIKILRFFTPARIQKMFNITSKYFSFFNDKPPANWVVLITRDFLLNLKLNESCNPMLISSWIFSKYFQNNFSSENCGWPLSYKSFHILRNSRLQERCS